MTTKDATNDLADQTLVELEKYVSRSGTVQAVREALNRQGLPLSGRNFMAAAIKGPDSQSPPHGKFVGRYPSRRMGHTLAIPEGWLGVAALDVLELDDEWVAYFDSPPKIKLSQVRNGRKVTYLARCAFAAVRRDKTLLIDLQPIKRLLEHEAAGSQLYVREGDGWTCPSAQAAAKAMGMEHQVWCERNFTRLHLSNLQILADYYAEEHLSASCAEEIEALQAAVKELHSPTCSELLSHLGANSGIDVVWRAIARGEVAVDLHHDDLSRHANVRIFPDAATQSAYAQAERAISRAAEWTPAYERDFRDGEIVLWNGSPAEIVHAGKTSCTIRTEKTTQPLTYEEIDALGEAFQRLKGSGALQDARREDALDIVANARPEDLETAVRRCHRVEPYIAGLKHSPACRTLRRHIALYRQAEIAYGCGFIGLLPRLAASGNRAKRLSVETLETVNEVIKIHYATPKNRNRRSVYSTAALACEEKGVPAPSYSWFCRHLKTLDQYWLKTAREGTKASYPTKPRSPKTDDDLLVDIEPVREWARAHLDHTQCDLETIFSDTGENLGRCWLTLMIDHFSRRILGFSISYEPPSYRAVLLCFRDCVRRHNRLPDQIVVDGGKEFRSAYFQALCAFYVIKIMWRPKREPRYGAPGERMFGTNNTMFLNNMSGNTQLTKNVRQMMPNVAPSGLAVWTLPELYPMCEKFLFSFYENEPHRELLMSPRQASERSVTQFGRRQQRFIRYSERFLLATCPSPRKGSAAVTPNGVKINYFWFNSDLLVPETGKSVRVKYEPYDLSKAWAYVGKCWVPLRSRFASLLCDLTERELMLITEEYRKRRGDVEHSRLNDRKLAVFVREIETQEEFLLARKRALELQRVLGSHPMSKADANEPAATETQPAEAQIDDEFEINIEDVELDELERF